jgi:type I restriction enzyme S subunit
MAARRLGDAAQIVMGQSPPGLRCNAEGLGLPLLNGPREFGPHRPSPVQFTTDARKRAQPGDVLFCVRGSTTGRMNWADREYAIGRGVAAIRHKTRPELQPFVRAVIEYALPGLLATRPASPTSSPISATFFPIVRYPRIRGPLSLSDTSSSDPVLLMQRKIERAERESRTLAALRDALLPKLISGKLRVKDAERILERAAP